MAIQQMTDSWYFYIFQKNSLLHCMQIVSKEDNLHEMLMPIFWKK